jgi:hypothetical protein
LEQFRPFAFRNLFIGRFQGHVRAFGWQAHRTG